MRDQARDQVVAVLLAIGITFAGILIARACDATGDGPAVRVPSSQPGPPVPAP